MITMILIRALEMTGLLAGLDRPGKSHKSMAFPEEGQTSPGKKPAKAHTARAKFWLAKTLAKLMSTSPMSKMLREPGHRQRPCHNPKVIPKGVARAC